MSKMKKSLVLLLVIIALPLAGCQSSVMGKPEEKPSSSEIVLVWERESVEGCHTVAINAQGQTQFGACSGPLSTGTILSDVGRPDDLRHFLESFQPFKADTPAGRINFSGHGARNAKASEQRAIGEWASIVYQELLYGRSGASWGMGMALNREGDHPCQEIQIEIYGKVTANDCREVIRPYPPVWLTAEQLDRFYEWIDRFQTAELEFQGKDGQPMRFIFGGKGNQIAARAELEEMLSWVGKIYEIVVAQHK